jgi:putative hydroxymethylpyrimidine transport system substrate-binding protein
VRRAALALAAAALLAGCGSSHHAKTAPTSPVSLTLALDFTPNAVHAPIYAAVREGLDRKNGIRLHIQTPGQSPDSLKDVLTGSADLGILDIQDLGLAVDKGEDVVAVAALVQRPLAAIIALPQIHRPKDLEGQRVGVSGLPSDPAFLRAVMGADGGDFAKVHTVTIGFAAVQSLISKRIVAVPAFWNAEGVALHAKGVPVREFRVDDYGAPRFPEVVLVTKRATLRREPRAVQAAVRAIAGGMGAVERDPGAAAADIAKASGSPLALVRAQLAAVTPIYGTSLDPKVLRDWAAWDAQTGLLPRAPDVSRAFAVSMSQP